MQCQAHAPPPRQYWEVAPAKAGVEPASCAALPVKARPRQVPPQLPAAGAAPKPAGAPPMREAVLRTLPAKAPPQVAAAEAANSSAAARYKTPSASGASSSQGASVLSERIVLPLPAKAPEAIARTPTFADTQIFGIDLNLMPCKQKWSEGVCVCKIVPFRCSLKVH